MAKWEFNPFTSNFDKTATIENAMIFKGSISVSSDFPTSAEVQNGWFYTIAADVTDDDATKTNTGQSFQSNDEIAWNGTDWTTLGNLRDVDYIDFDTNITIASQEGRLKWNSDDGTLEVGMPGGNVSLQIGQETLIRVKATEDILNGQPVYISGASGSKPEVSLANATNHIVATSTIAVATEDITSGQFGYVNAFGLVRGIDTSFAIADGGPAFLSTTDGVLTGTPPAQPNSQVFIGVVLRKHANEGVLLVKIIPQPNLEELSNVSIDNITDKDLIQYDNATTTYQNKSSYDAGIVAQTDWAQNGFPTKTTSTIDFTDGNRTFSIQPTGTDFDYFVEGVKYTSTGDTLQITDVEGIHAIFYDGDTLTCIANPASYQFQDAILHKALVCIMYWDVSAQEGIYVGEERHGMGMSPSVHNYLHFIYGLAYLNGLGLNTINADGSGATADAQFGVDSGGLVDEDIHISVDAVTSTTGLPIYYMLGASSEWQRHIEPGFSMRTVDGTSATRLAYNEYTGGAWQLTDVGNADFVLCHIFGTTEKDKPMIAVMGQNKYTTKRNARAGALTEIHSLITNDVLFPEIRAIATVIMQTRTTYASAINAKIVSTDEGDDYIDWRDQAISRTEISTTDHGNLSGLGSDDHTQYLLEDGTRAMSGDLDMDSNSITNVATLDNGGSTIIVNDDVSLGEKEILFDDNTGTYVGKIHGTTIAGFLDQLRLSYKDDASHVILSSAVTLVSGDWNLTWQENQGLQSSNTPNFGASSQPFGTGFINTLDLGTNTITDGNMTGNWNLGTGDLATTGDITCDTLNYTSLNPAVDLSGKANVALDNLSGVAINTSLISDTDNTDDLGSSTKRWKETHSDKVFAGEGNLNLTNSGLVFGETYGTGIITNPGYGCFFGGFAGTGSKIYSPGISKGAFAQGNSIDNGVISSYGFAQGYTRGSKISANDSGAFAQGRALAGGATKGIHSNNGGSFAQGYTYNSKIEATALGSFAQGMCPVYSGISSTNSGSFAQGYCYLYANLTSSGRGSFAQGSSTLFNAAITASGDGAFAQGYAYYNGTIISNNNGTLAHGFAGYNQTITASANGAGAFGYTAGSNIIASAENAFQFGPGTNAQANSLQVGTQMRLKGTTGAPASALHNGDIWVNNNYVYIRSNGVSCKVVNNPL